MHPCDCGKDGKQSKEAFNVENDEITKQNKNRLATQQINIIIQLYIKKINKNKREEQLQVASNRECITTQKGPQFR